MRTLLCLVAMALVAHAEVVDRIAVRVGRKIITASEVELRVRLAAFQNHEKAELTAAHRKEAARQLVDQRLVEREMELGRYPRLETGKKGLLLPAYAGQFYGGDAGALGAELAKYGVTPGELEEDLARQADLLTFLGLRFRIADDVGKADAGLDVWIREQRGRTVIEYLEKELAP